MKRYSLQILAKVKLCQSLLLHLIWLDDLLGEKNYYKCSFVSLFLICFPFFNVFVQKKKKNWKGKCLKYEKFDILQNKMKKVNEQKLDLWWRIVWKKKKKKNPSLMSVNNSMWLYLGKSIFLFFFNYFLSNSFYEEIS